MSERYTEQGEFGFLGKRWYCALVTLFNFFEEFLGRKIDLGERAMIILRFMTLGNRRTRSPVDLCNYMNHESVWSGKPVAAGWGMGANPEAHGLINNWKWAVVEIADVLEVELDEMPKTRYQIGVMDVDANPDTVSTHFVPLKDGKMFHNPDPGLEGPIVEYRDFPA